VTAAATVSAAPALRDFKKESTAFVPASLKRKKAGPGSSNISGTTGKVNAAPSLASSESAEDAPLDPVRPDLVGTLSRQFGVPPPPSKKHKVSDSGKPKGDYEKFVDEMGDILGPKA